MEVVFRQKYGLASHRDVELESKSFAAVKGNLLNIRMLHTDRGSEYDNLLIDDLLAGFQIGRSLSIKGCPCDNAVAASTFKMIKAEFIYSSRFKTLEQIQTKLADYVHWFNHFRIHSTLGYLIPAEFKQICP